MEEKEKSLKELNTKKELGEVNLQEKWKYGKQ